MERNKLQRISILESNQKMDKFHLNKIKVNIKEKVTVINLYFKIVIKKK